MFIFIIIAFLITSFMISRRYDRDMIEAVPVTAVLLICVLYILAFFRQLGIIDYIAAGLIVLYLILFAVYPSKKNLSRDLAGKLLEPDMIFLYAMTVLLIFLEKDRIFTWWDDINFWATDTKSIYYLGGFAGKYGNVSPSFGDYPQGLQLFKWLFLHMSPDRYIEGLQFAGYYVLNLIFLIPAVHHAPQKIRPFMTAALLLIPGIADGIHYSGTCADVTMGIVFGSLLSSMYEYRENDRFSIIRITLYSVFLVSIKSAGAGWALLALAFWIFVRGYKGRKIWIPVVSATAYLASWLSFCYVRRRIAKLTSEGLHMAAGGFNLPDDAGELVHSFLKAFLTVPMHTDSNITFDLSTASLAIFLIIMPIVSYRLGYLKKKEAVWISLFELISAAASYGIIFIAHITIFQTETQYLDPKNMALSISRYGAPFTIGGLILMACILSGDRAEAGKSLSDDGAAGGLSDNIILKDKTHIGPMRKKYVLPVSFIIFVLLCTDYSGIRKAMGGYHETLAGDTAYRQSMTDEDGILFEKNAEKYAGTDKLWGKRVAYFRDSKNIHWVKDTYISAEVSPVPVVYYDISDIEKKSDFSSKVMQSHAEFLYSDDAGETAEDMISGFTYIGSEKFQYAHFYCIIYCNGSFRLEPAFGMDN